AQPFLGGSNSHFAATVGGMKSTGEPVSKMKLKGPWPLILARMTMCLVSDRVKGTYTALAGASSAAGRGEAKARSAARRWAVIMSATSKLRMAGGNTRKRRGIVRQERGISCYGYNANLPQRHKDTMVKGSADIAGLHSLSNKRQKQIPT